MPLNPSPLSSALYAISSDVGGLKSASEMAHRKADALYDFGTSGMPMTVIVTLPGGVSGPMTAGTVKGNGIGGIDKPAPGMGLAAAKAILESQLVSAWAIGMDAQASAEKEAQAIYSYLSQAMVMTQDESLSPLPVPPVPPLGPVPVVGSVKGSGGLISASAGKGLSSAKQDLIETLTQIYSQVKSQKSLSEQAAQVAAAIHAFYSEAVVTTHGTIAAVGVPAVSYGPGAGSSVSGSIT